VAAGAGALMARRSLVDLMAQAFFTKKLKSNILLEYPPVPGGCGNN
jgi:hypothetical protein